jgi:hypothetical protein
MNWRAMLLSGVLGTGLLLGAAPAEAHCNDNRYGGYEDSYYGGGGYEGGGSYQTSYAQCGQYVDRIRRDQAKINELGPTGRHRKALGWFQNDLRDASRDYNNCRSGGGSNVRYDPYYDNRSYGRSYDPYYDRNTSYDPYGSSYDPYNDGFKFKRDWPALLGIFLNGQVGQ